MTASEIILDILQALDEHLQRDEPVPLDLTAAVVDALNDLVEGVAALEATTRAHLAQSGGGDSLRGMPGGEALRKVRRGDANTVDLTRLRPPTPASTDNVVLFPIVPRPVQPTQMSGCFAFPDDAS